MLSSTLSKPVIITTTARVKNLLGDERQGFPGPRLRGKYAVNGTIR
jgi:hypothetical protein